MRHVVSNAGNQVGNGRETCDMQVVGVEIAADGVEIRANSTNGTQIFLIKCKDMPAGYIAKSGNVKPLLIIPGPKAPKHFDVYWHIIFSELFIKYGPKSTGLLPCTAVNITSDARNACQHSVCAVLQSSQRTLLATCARLPVR